VKVLITHERFLPDWGGGGETIVYETARRLSNQGVEVRVITTGDPSIREYEGIPTDRIPIHRYRMNMASAAIEEGARWSDLIQTFNYHACRPSVRAGAKTGRPVVCGFLGLFGDAWLDIKGCALGRMFRAWERRLLGLPFDRLCFLSEFSKRQAVELGSAAARSRVVCPGIQLDRFTPSLRKEQLVLFVGKFSRRKGVYEVLEAARALPEYRFRMIGWGPEEKALRRSAPPNLDVERGEAGRPPLEDYARARVFLFPSHAETLGLVIPEAMASGCAVISGVPLDFHGVRCEPGDTGTMVQGIRALMRDDAYFDECSRANLNLARRYDWTVYAASLLSIYREILEEKRGPGRIH
jgi:glycosyltransferase involved in cell wall biosynthesis